MRLLRFAVDGEAKLGLAAGDEVIDLAAAWRYLRERGAAGPITIPNDMRAFLAAGAAALEAARMVWDTMSDAGPRRALPRVVSGERLLFPLADVRVLAPIPDPGKLILLGTNYHDHQVETNLPVPATPLIFAKYANAITGPFDPILLPKAAPDQVDYEAELAFVVGRRARHVPLEQAGDYIAGYMALNDISARDLQFAQSQWLIGKTPDSFAPTGPWLVTRDEIPSPHGLGVRCYVNGVLRQDSNTACLIFDVPYLLHYLSRFMTLDPGDIVSTGTPAGVGYTRRPPVFLRAGDVVRVEIGGVGALENPVAIED